MFSSQGYRPAVSWGLCAALLFGSVDRAPLAAAGAAPSLISADHAAAIYRHIVQTHWVPATGLFLSFPDSMDRKLSQQASVYEEAATGLLLVQLGDFDRARGIFDFLKRMWDSEPQRPGRNGIRGLSNFYNAEFGTDGIEKTIHSGPNAWAGLFAARLANTTRDSDARLWALDVAYWLANAVPHQDGAVAMGPRDDPGGAPWSRVFSTENNISYYAMLTELLRSPSIDRDQRIVFTQERDRVENWLVNRAINRSTYVVYRGVNPQGIDRMAALDTVTWLICAVGPKRLAQRGIDPRRLMLTAEKSFECDVNGRHGVDPTDAREAEFVYLHERRDGQPARPSAPGHRVIWYEGMGQFILTLATLGDYEQSAGHADWAAQDIHRAERLAREFDQAALRNYPDRSAYAYATPGKFFHDGWEAQTESAEGPASSLIAAIWRCFAGLGVDPLSGKQIPVIANVRVSLPDHISLDPRRPAVLYGTSEEMIGRAWRALNQRHWDDAIAQSEATIQEWQSWAVKLQDEKQRAEGGLMSYDGTPESQHAICKYWALNDVGGAYFILGKAFDAEGRYDDAARAFQQVALHYSLSQIWDPHGWFWAPLEAITNEFVARDPRHYGQVVPDELAQSGDLTGKRPY